MKTTAGNVKKGDFIVHQDDIWQVIKTDFHFQGRGMATVRLRIKSLSNGKNIELGFKSPEQLEQAEVTTTKMQYLYKDESSLYFMDDNYNQHEVSLAVAKDIANYMKEGDSYYLLFHHDRALTVRPPASVKLKVIETENAIKGDTVSGAKKKAKVETGIIVMVPLFIKEGELIVVNPESGQYVERVKE